MSTSDVYPLEVKPKDDHSILVPVNVYGNRVPASISAVLRTGRYRWLASVPVQNSDGQQIAVYKFEGSFEVVPWPEEDRQWLEIINRDMKKRIVNMDNYLKLSSIRNELSDARLRSSLDEKLMYYEKRLGLTKAYETRIRKLRMSPKKSAVDEYILRREEGWTAAGNE